MKIFMDLYINFNFRRLYTTSSQPLYTSSFMKILWTITSILNFRPLYTTSSQHLYIFYEDFYGPFTSILNFRRLYTTSSQPFFTSFFIKIFMDLYIKFEFSTVIHYKLPAFSTSFFMEILYASSINSSFSVFSTFLGELCCHIIIMIMIIFIIIILVIYHRIEYVRICNYNSEYRF